MRTRRALPRSVSGLLCIALIVILGAAGATPALALDTTTRGTAPLWFQFNVGSVDPDTKTSHVSVTLRDQAQCRGGFQVFASGSYSFWDTPDEEDLVGRATDIGNDMHMWAGELVPGAYYVNVGYGAQPGCVLGVSGKAVDFLGIVDLGWHLEEEPADNPGHNSAFQPQERTTLEDVTASIAAANQSSGNPVPQANPAPAPAMAQTSGNPAPQANPAPAMAAASNNPHNEMEMVPNQWMPVNGNGPMMFEFEVGNVPDEQTSSVGITLYGAPFRAGRFEIFTANGVPFDRPEQDDWFGKAIMEDGENPSWNGDLVPGAYYVLVYPRGMREVLLSVSGQAIAF